MSLVKAYLSLELLVWVAIIGALVFLAYRRYQAKKTENFEERDN